MPQSDPLDVLIAHSHWANANLLRACTPLTEDQYHRRFEVGLGSLHDTLTHIVSATGRWSDLLAGRAERPRLEGDGVRRTAADLYPMLNAADAELMEGARSGPLEQVFTGTRGGRPYRITRGGVVTHVTTHAMHHRAQCLNMLRHLGVTPLPMSSVLEWMLTVDVGT
jgi:uncharacterized damage-inducible protein DinB